MFHLILSAYAGFCYGMTLPVLAWLFLNESGATIATTKGKLFFAAFVLLAPISIPVSLAYVSILGMIEFKSAG